MKFRGIQFSPGVYTIFNPAVVTLVMMTLLVIVVIINANGDPLALAQLGTFFSEGDPDGTQGYDGQFVYYIARDPSPDVVGRYLDVPAYRYQRILSPLLAYILVLGNVPALPWILPFIGILAQVAGAFAVSELLDGWGISRWYALSYGLWVGFGLAIRLDLPESLAYGLVVWAILMSERKRPFIGWILYGLALFAKEVTVLFMLAAVISATAQQRWKDVLGLGLFALLPFTLFQVWLWIVFGQPGIGSGGAMATSFEFIPYMGLLRIGFYSSLYLIAMLVVFIPSIVLPSVWGVWSSIKRLILRDTHIVVLALLFNSLTIAFLPFSTFRETGGILRFACGLVLAVVLFAGRYQIRRVLLLGQSG